jgi:formimidoylglutamate deiminase
MIKHFFANIYTDEGWQHNLLMSADASGLIVSLQNGTSEEADFIHTGYTLPGMANVHSHAFQRAMAGLAEVRGNKADSFWSWRKIMYSFLSEINPDQFEAIASQLYIEMLKAGFTSVGEFHYLHKDKNGAVYSDAAEMSNRIFSATSETGIGLTLLPVLYQFGGFGGAKINGQQNRFTQTTDDFVTLVNGLMKRASEMNGVRIGVAPHSLRAVDHTSLTELLEAIPVDMPCHIHISEQILEVTECLEWSGQRPVQWLSNNVDLSERWCLVHATHLVPREITSIAKSGAVVGLCPITEANLGDGIFPAPEYMDQGGKIAVGSDSNVLVSLAEECRLLEYGQRLSRQSRNILGHKGISTGERIFKEAVLGGHQALGGPESPGLIIGGKANFVVLDAKHPALQNKPDWAIVDSWIFAGDNSVVKDVAVDGNMVIIDRHHVSEEQIIKRFGEAMKELVANL